MAVALSAEVPARAVRRQLRKARRASVAARPVTEVLQDLYVGLFGMRAGLRDGGAAGPRRAAGRRRPRRGGSRRRTRWCPPWAWRSALVCVGHRPARAQPVGPVVCDPARATWLLASPVSRAGLLGAAAGAALAGTAVVGASCGLAVGLLLAWPAVASARGRRLSRRPCWRCSRSALQGRRGGGTLDAPGRRRAGAAGRARAGRRACSGWTPSRATPIGPHRRRWSRSRWACLLVLCATAAAAGAGPAAPRRPGRRDRAGDRAARHGDRARRVVRRRDAAAAAAARARRGRLETAARQRLRRAGLRPTSGGARGLAADRWPRSARPRWSGRRTTCTGGSARRSCCVRGGLGGCRAPARPGCAPSRAPRRWPVHCR